MKRGVIGEYVWGEFWKEEPELFVPDVVRGLCRHIVGLKAVNVSWDSGRLALGDPACPAGSTMDGKYLVTPPIDERLAHSWPRSHCGFDEWYFFREVPKSLAPAAFCNRVGSSLSEWIKLVDVGGPNFSEQLPGLAPVLVIGEGHQIFLITNNPSVLAAFEGLAKE